MISSVLSNFTNFSYAPSNTTKWMFIYLIISFLIGIIFLFIMRKINPKNYSSNHSLYEMLSLVISVILMFCLMMYAPNLKSGKYRAAAKILEKRDKLLIIDKPAEGSSKQVYNWKNWSWDPEKKAYKCVLKQSIPLHGDKNLSYGGRIFYVRNNDPKKVEVERDSAYSNLTLIAELVVQTYDKNTKKSDKIYIAQHIVENPSYIQSAKSGNYSDIISSEINLLPTRDQEEKFLNEIKKYKF